MIGLCEVVILGCLIGLVVCVYYMCNMLEECRRCKKRFVFLTDGQCEACWDKVRND